MDSVVLFAYVTTHNTFLEGGRKSHVGVRGKENALCGFWSGVVQAVSADATVEWLSMADPDGEVCKKCRKAALKLISNTPPHEQRRQG